MSHFSQFTLGRVVKHKNPNCFPSNKPYVYGLYGHIVGFDTVEYDTVIDTILIVKWANGMQVSVHPGNVELV